MDTKFSSVAPIRSWSSGRVLGDINTLISFFDEAGHESSEIRSGHRSDHDCQSSTSSYSDDDFCSFETSDSETNTSPSKSLPLSQICGENEGSMASDQVDDENTDYDHSCDNRLIVKDDRRCTKSTTAFCQCSEERGTETHYGLLSDCMVEMEAEMAEKHRVEMIREARRKHKKMYRKYLDSLRETRSIQEIQRANGVEDAKEKKDRLTKAVLSRIKSQSLLDTEVKDGAHEDKQSTAASERDNRYYTRHKSSMLAKKHVECLLNVQKSWQQKKSEDENLKKRLQKRAMILRKKYEMNLPSEKIWERNESNSKKKAPRGSLTNTLVNSNSVVQRKDALGVRMDYPEDQTMKLSKSMVSALGKRLSGIHGANENGKILSFEKGGDKKVFSVIGCYPSIRNDLIQRGWIPNDDRESNDYDLKFSLSTADIDFASMRRNQIVNHFHKSRCLTTKVGLCQTLSNCPLFANFVSDKHGFFPRAYDLSRTEEIFCFVEDHHLLQTKGTLIRMLKIYESNCTVKVNRGVIRILCRFLRHSGRRVKEDSSIDTGGLHGYQSFSPMDSVIIESSKDWIYHAVTEHEFDSKMALMELLQSSGVHEKSASKDNDIVKSGFERELESWKRKHVPTLSDMIPLDSNVSNIIRKCLQIHTPTKLSPQDHINGDITKNIWIIKPHGSSRGRGIKVSAGSLNEVLMHVKPSFNGSKPNQFVIQKYIENPLTIQGRKFDLRQWVLVTSWNPLRIWFYSDCYVRFAVDLYEDPEDLNSKEFRYEWENNPYKHMVNNSIGKKCKKFKESFTVEETGSTVNGYMWSLDDFREWLLTKTGEDTWEQSLAPQIKNIVVDSILCAQESMIEERRRCFEVYGFDIMIDSNMHPWLIEVNSSPACDYSTPVTESYVKRALPDVLKVVLDIGWVQDDNLQGKDSGGWDLIHSGPIIPKVVGRFGSDMTLKGIPMKRPIRNRRLRHEKLREKRETDHLTFDDSDLSDYEKQYLSKEVSKDTSAIVSKFYGMDKENLNSFNKINNKATNPSKIYQKKREIKRKNALPINTITLGIQL